MVNANKIERKLPSLLMEHNVQRIDNDYKKKQYAITKLKREQPTIFNNFMINFTLMLDQLDRAAESVGQQHIGLDARGNFITYQKRR
jgi:hypothetical protein